MLLASVLDRLVTIGVPVSEKILRTVVVYLAVLVLLRLFGNRTAAQLNSFDVERLERKLDELIAPVASGPR